MSDIFFPAVLNEPVTRHELRDRPDIRMVSIAFRVADKIYIRCRLAEAQNWRCCWCGIDCVPEPGHAVSATIEHVQPRSQGGADHWDNYAMACATCNHRRGTASVEDMIAGRVERPVPDPELKRMRDARARAQRKIRTGHKLNARGWVTVDGEPMCKEKWIASLRLTDELAQEVRDAVFQQEYDQAA